MTWMYNTFEGGIDDTNLTRDGSGGASGTAFSHVIINGASTPSGGTAIQYETAAALGGDIGCRITLQPSTTYLRWTDAAPDARGVVRVPIKIPSTWPAAFATFATIYQVGGSFAADVGVSAAGNIAVRQVGSSEVVASRYAASLSTLYWVEMAVTKGTTTSDGTIALKVYAADGTTELWSYSSSALNTGTANLEQFRIGGHTTSTGWTTTDYDSVQAGCLASGFWGPLANIDPTIVIDPDHLDRNVGESAVFVALDDDPDGVIVARQWGWNYPISGAPSISGATTAVATVVAPAAPFFGEIYCQVTDDGGSAITDVAELRVPSSAVVRPLPRGGYGASWTRVGSATTDGAALADELDTTYLESPTVSGTESKRKVRLYPSTTRSTLVLANRLWTDSGTATAKVRLIQGITGSVLQEWTHTVDTTATTYTDTASGATVAAITDWGDLYVEIAVTT